MSEVGRRQFWQLVALAGLGGAIAAGVWIGLIRPAEAEPTVPLTAAAGDSSHAAPRTWVRSGVHVPPPSVSDIPDATHSNLQIPQVPDVSSNAGLVIPVVTPQVPTMPPPPPVESEPAGPRNLDAGVIAGGVQLPKIPEIPSAIPVQITPIPVATLPTIPSIQAVSYDTLPIPAIPAAAAPGSTAFPQTVPVAPPPASSTTPLPVLPTPDTHPAPTASVPPTTQPLQFPDVVQPVMPVSPESTLPSANSGISVKSGADAGGVPVAPSALPQWPAPSAPMTGGSLSSSMTGPSQVLPTAPLIAPPGMGTVVDHSKPIETTLPAAQLLDTQKRPGDDTMTTTRKQITILTALAGMFLAPGPVLKAEDDKAQSEVAELKKQIKDNGEQLELVNKKLGDLQRDLKKLNETLNEALNGKKDPMGYPLTSDPGILSELKTLKDKVRDVETALNQFKTQTSSLSPQKPVTSGTETLPPAGVKARKGTIRIVNEYPVQISMLINGTTSYKVEPSKARDIEVPAGDFTYQLLESGAPATKSTIRDNETVTLRIK